MFDTPVIEDVATENITAAGFDDEISFQAGDYESHDFEEMYDCVLLFNIVHGNDPEMNREVFRTVIEVVEDEGTVVLLDQFRDESQLPIANTGSRFLDLTYFLTLCGWAYHSESVRSWLADAGFRVRDRTEFPKAKHDAARCRTRIALLLMTCFIVRIPWRLYTGRLIK